MSSHVHTGTHTHTHIHTIILATPRQQESVSARPERKIKATGKPAPDVPGAYSWASPWLRGLGRPAKLGLRKGDDVSTLAQSPASSCPPSGSLEHMLHGASWECQASPLHPPPSNHSPPAGLASLEGLRLGCPQGCLCGRQSGGAGHTYKEEQVEEEEKVFGDFDTG